MRDIDKLIDVLKRKIPNIRVEKLQVLHESDDDGLWFCRHSGSSVEINIESSDGMFPFLLESDRDEKRVHAECIDEVVSYVTSVWGISLTGTTGRGTTA